MYKHHDCWFCDGRILLLYYDLMFKHNASSHKVYRIGRNVYLSVKQTFIQLLSEFINSYFEWMSVVDYQMWLSLLALLLLILALGSDLILGTSCSVWMRLGFTYMAGAVHIVVPTYWNTHNFIIHTATIKTFDRGFCGFYQVLLAHSMIVSCTSIMPCHLWSV